jgi:hypothetical protein
MRGCMSILGLLGLLHLQLVVEKEARQAAYRLHCSNHLKKIRLGTFCYFQDGNIRFPSFTGRMTV